MYNLFDEDDALIIDFVSEFIIEKYAVKNYEKEAMLTFAIGGAARLIIKSKDKRREEYAIIYLKQILQTSSDI